jgi:hypothetical protein
VAPYETAPGHGATSLVHARLAAAGLQLLAAGGDGVLGPEWTPRIGRRRGRSGLQHVLCERKLQTIALGQAPRRIKLFIRARGEELVQNAIRAGFIDGAIESGLIAGARAAAISV